MSGPFVAVSQVSQPHDFRSALNAALVALALRDPDPVERAAKLAILKKDGWL